MLGKSATLLVGLVLVVACQGNESPPLAIIVDQLSLTQPNPAFQSQATDLLEDAGYEVQYVPGDMVTVEFFTNMEPAEIVLFRTHMGVLGDSDLVAMFTGESLDLNDPEYIDELVGKRLAATWNDDPDKAVYGLMPQYIAVEMDLHGATVVLMGCSGTLGIAMSDAFMKANAKEVIGWTDLVGAFHSDRATIQYLQHKLAGVENPLERVMQEVGPDPTYHSELRRTQ